MQKDFFWGQGDSLMALNSLTVFLILSGHFFPFPVFTASLTIPQTNKTCVFNIATLLTSKKVPS